MFFRRLYTLVLTYVIRPVLYRFFVLRWEVFRKPPFHFVYYGFKIFYKPRDGLVYHVGSLGSFEKDVLECCAQRVSDNAVFIDVGANIGLITVPLARRLPHAQFHCFEPSVYPYHYFRMTIQENNLGERITLNKIGLYEKKTTLKFYTHAHKDASGDGIKDTHRAGRAVPTTIRVTTLDEYIKHKNIKKVDVIKIDIEGSELFALKGAVKTIRRFSPKIVFEAWPENLKAYDLTVEDVYSFFQSIQYRIYTIGGKMLTKTAFQRETTIQGNFQALPI